MKELYLYDLYGMRGEIKVLEKILNQDESVNCFATGVRDGLRRMLVVTNYRVIIVGSHAASAPDLFIIPRKDVTSHSAAKRFFASSIEFTTKNGARYELRNVSRRVLELFEWALEQPIREFDD